MVGRLEVDIGNDSNGRAGGDRDRATHAGKGNPRVVTVVTGGVDSRIAALFWYFLDWRAVKIVDETAEVAVVMGTEETGTVETGTTATAALAPAAEETRKQTNTQEHNQWLPINRPAH